MDLFQNVSDQNKTDKKAKHYNNFLLFFLNGIELFWHTIEQTKRKHSEIFASFCEQKKKLELVSLVYAVSEVSVLFFANRRKKKGFGRKYLSFSEGFGKHGALSCVGWNKRSKNVAVNF